MGSNWKQSTHATGRRSGTRGSFQPLSCTYCEDSFNSGRSAAVVKIRSRLSSDLRQEETVMASIGSYLPSPGKVAWRLDAAQGDVAEGNKVRHVMIRSAEVWEKPTPHVVSHCIGS